MACEVNSITLGEVRITTSLNDNGDYTVIVYDAVTGEDLRIIDGQYTSAQLAQRRRDRPYRKIEEYAGYKRANKLAALLPKMEG